MAKTQTAAQTAPAVDEAALAEMRRLIFDAPIAELAESQGISIDEAVKLRVEKNLEEAPCRTPRHGSCRRSMRASPLPKSWNSCAAGSGNWAAPRSSWASWTIWHGC